MLGDSVDWKPGSAATAGFAGPAPSAANVSATAASLREEERIGISNEPRAPPFAGGHAASMC
jgi:hypothetical protein